MPADPIHPDELDGHARFRANLVAYLDSLPVGELAALLGELPRSRQEPLGLGVLMIALNEQLPDGYKLLPPVGQPGPGEGRRARYGWWSPTAAPPAVASTLMGQRRDWPSGWPTANGRPSSTLSAPGRARWRSGEWPRRCAPGPAAPPRRPAARSPVILRPSHPAGSATGHPIGPPLAR
jgi:hypothetical protein